MFNGIPKGNAQGSGGGGYGGYSSPIGGYL